MARGALEITAWAKHQLKLCPTYRPKHTVLPKYSTKAVADCHVQMFSTGVVAVKEKKLIHVLSSVNQILHIKIRVKAVLDVATKFGAVEGGCFGLF